MYADINGWKLVPPPPSCPSAAAVHARSADVWWGGRRAMTQYLRDMKMVNAIAAEITNRMMEGQDAEQAVTGTLAVVPIKLGQKKNVALLELIPAAVVQDAVDVVKTYADDVGW